jgi:branched-chain amino acid transport system substrate-binding protein
VRWKASLVCVVALAAGAATAAPVAPPTCSAVVYEGDGAPDLVVASDLPLGRANRAQTAPMVDAIRLVLRRHGFRAGPYRLGFRSCDDASAESGSWDPESCFANAKGLAADPSVVGVVGTWNSGCAEVELPVLNVAPGGPLAMVSPINTYAPLTRRAPGANASQPRRYYPTGIRSYARVAAADDVQAAAAAVFARRLKARRAYVLVDGETYGNGLAAMFRGAARRLSIRIVGSAPWSLARSYRALAAKVAHARPQLVYVAGLVDRNGLRLLADLRRRLGSRVRILVPEGFLSTNAAPAGIRGPGYGAYVVFHSVPPSRLPAAGDRFRAQYRAAYRRAADQFAVQAAEATEALVAAIARSDGSRRAVTAALLGTRRADGLFGAYRFDRQGDLEPAPVTVYAPSRGRLTPAAVIRPSPALRAAADAGG